MDQRHIAGVLDAIDNRSSVRAYTGEAIERRAILRLIDAAVRAPTAMHEEPWQFLVVQDEDRLRSLSDRAKLAFSEEATRLHTPGGDSAAQRFSQPAFDIFYGAGTLIVICAKDYGPFAIADCWLAAENLMLAATALGYGTCVIGSATSTLNAASVKEELGIPAQSTAIAPIIVGHASGSWPGRVRIFV